MPRVKKVTQRVKNSQDKKTKIGLTIPVYSVDGKETGNLILPKEIFSVEASPKLLAQYVRVYLANHRQGTASTKTRGEVSGSTRKIYKQKGTGRARHGDIKAPVFIGGGVVGGPKPRDFSLKINKKQKKRSLFYSLTLKLKGNEILGISDEFFKLEPKTKKIAGFLKTMRLEGKHVLFILPKMEKNNLILAARNLAKVHILDPKLLNAYDVLKSKIIFLNTEVLNVLKQRFLSQ